MRLKPIIVFLIGLIITIPALLWLIMYPPSLRFSSFWQIFTSIGQLSALVGFSLMAVTITLAVRIPFLEKQFKGLNRIFANHHQWGSIAFILLMVHPLSLSIRYLPTSIFSAATFLLPSLTSWQQSLGLAALTLIMILLVITFYLNWRYQNWKFSHRFLGVAFLIAFLHIAFITSDISVNWLLRSYLFILGGLALTAFSYRLLVEFGNVGKYQFSISGLQNIAPDVWEVSLKLIKGNFHYLPGQFAFFTIDQPMFSHEDHPFSIVSEPTEPDLKFAAKAVGDYTQNLSQLKKGTQVWVEGPYGTFGKLTNLENPGQPNKAVWIAGGIGITPFVSLAKSLVQNSGQADLFYSAKQADQTAYRRELINLAKIGQSNFTLYLHNSDKDGHLTAEIIEKTIGNLAKRTFLICGPSAMMTALKLQLAEKDVPTDNIQTEDFSY